MSKFYTYNAWSETFKPIKNTISKYPDDSLIHFETYGEEFDFVKEQDPKTIWTEVDGDEGTYIMSGYHFVNRIHYYITENPWDDEYTEVPTWCYRTCDCTEESEDGDYNPDCPECDEGMIDIPIDTVEDLKAIYGEDNADVIA
jgi:hypothetical protein